MVAELLSALSTGMAAGPSVGVDGPAASSQPLCTSATPSITDNPTATLLHNNPPHNTPATGHLQLLTNPELTAATTGGCQQEQQNTSSHQQNDNPPPDQQGHPDVTSPTKPVPPSADPPPPYQVASMGGKVSVSNFSKIRK